MGNRGRWETGKVTEEEDMMRYDFAHFHWDFLSEVKFTVIQQNVFLLLSFLALLRRGRVAFSVLNISWGKEWMVLVHSPIHCNLDLKSICIC